MLSPLFIIILSTRSWVSLKCRTEQTLALRASVASVFCDGMVCVQMLTCVCVCVCVYVCVCVCACVC
jgi:hypothetical protein